MPAPTQRTLHITDITTIVFFALDTCIFRACHHTYKQIRGAGIGSQLPPALCNVAITLIECARHQLQPPQPHESPLHLLPLCGQPLHHPQRTFLHHPAAQTLINPDFFGNPVELEPVDDFHLLGFNIDLASRTITYAQPSQPWKTRGAASAGSQRLCLAGLASGIHTIHKYTYPCIRGNHSGPPPHQPLLGKGAPSSGLPTVFESEISSASERRNAAPCACVPPCPKGFPSVFGHHSSV